MRSPMLLMCSVVVVLAASLPSQANSVVVDPTQSVAGISQLELSQQWWQWVSAIPAASNPLTDVDGSLAGTNNSGPVFFLAGNFGGNSVRSFSIPADTPIFFPVVNAFDAEIKGGACDLTCAFGFLNSFNVGGASVHATLDGADLLTYPTYRQTSTSFFDIFLPVDNVYAATPPYVGTLDTISDGHWVALMGLSPGQHTLVFGGTLPVDPPFNLELIDHINVVPEPASILVLFVAKLFSSFARLRMTHNS